MTAVRHEPIILIGVVSESNKHTYVTGGTQRKIYTAALLCDLCHINTLNMILIVLLPHVHTVGYMLACNKYPQTLTQLLKSMLHNWGY